LFVGTVFVPSISGNIDIVKDIGDNAVSSEFYIDWHPMRD